MALFYLIRHGEPTYDHMLENGFWGFGRDFAPLTEKGKQQVEMTAKDIRLIDAEIIVSSPYTRALQTAQIISRETGIPVEVEIAHGMVFRCLTYIEKIQPAEIVECTYQRGQADCEYSFT